MTFVSMISLCILVFRFVRLTTAVRLVSLLPYSHKYFSVKSQKLAFFQPLTLKVPIPQNSQTHSNNS